jgi:hypothetical protein
MRGNEWRSIGRIEHFGGVRIEGDDDGFTFQGPGYFLYTLKEAYVSNMDTIEVANGDHWVAKGPLDIVYAINHFHGNDMNLQLLLIRG